MTLAEDTYFASEKGQSMVELAIALPVLILLLLAAADFGRLLYFWMAVNSAARAGAQYGSQTVITAASSSKIILAATTDGSSISGLTATTCQCTCASGTIQVCPGTCSGSSYYCPSGSEATYLEVDTQATFHTIISYPGIPSSITVKGRAIMQVKGS